MCAEEDGRASVAIKRRGDTVASSVKRAVSGRQIAVTHDLLQSVRKVKHYFDVWHRAKKISARLKECAAKKKMMPLREWIPSVRNHFWFCSRACNGDADVLLALWRGVLYHVQGIHTWPDGQCTHAADFDSDKTPLEPMSPAMTALRNVVLDEKQLKLFPYYVRFL